MTKVKFFLFVALIAVCPLHVARAAAPDDAERLKELEAKVARLEAIMENVDHYIDQQVEARIQSQRVTTRAAATPTPTPTPDIDALVEKKVAEQLETKMAESVSVSDKNAVKVSLNPGLKIERADKKHSFQVGGRLQVDGALFNDDKTDQPDGTNVRRARLNVSGKVFNDWVYKAEYDFANDSTALKDAYIGYTGFDDISFRLGHIKEPLTMDTMTSSLHGLFVERSAAATIFHPIRNIGIDGLYVSDHWHVNAGAYRDGPTASGSNDDEEFSVTGRLVFAPVLEDDALLHLGMSGSYRKPDAGLESVQYRERPENTVQSDRLIDTGSISDVDYYTLGGLELAAAYKSFWGQAEYVRSDLTRDNGQPDANFDSYYGQIGYVLTGESRPYSLKSATFGRLKPAAPLSEAGWGAFELGARYSHVDLNDASASITGGEMDSYTLGLNWYPETHLKFQANYIWADTDSQAVTANDDPQIFLIRAQYDF